MSTPSFRRNALPYRTQPAIPKKQRKEFEQDIQEFMALRFPELQKLCSQLKPEEQREFDWMCDEVEKLFQAVTNKKYDFRATPAYYFKNAEDNYQSMKEARDFDKFKWLRYYTEDLLRGVKAIEEVEERNLPDIIEGIRYVMESYFYAEGWDITNPTVIPREKDQQELDEFFKTTNWNPAPVLEELNQFVELSGRIKEGVTYEKAWYNYLSKAKKEEFYTKHEKIFPEGVEPLEVMWHVTTAYSTVMQEGLKSSEQLEKPAGLGGGRSDLVSFTASLDHAEGIRDAMLDMARIVRGPRTLEAVDEYRQELGISDEGWEWIQETFNNIWGADNVEKRFGYLVEYTLSRAQEEGIRYNPVFMGADIRERFAALDPDEIEIVEAVVDTTDEETTYHFAEEEFRIPPKNILSIGPVGSQEKALEEKMKAKKPKVLHQGSIYVQAADPQRDVEFQQQAQEAYDKLNRKIERGFAEPLYTSEEDETIEGWVVKLESNLLVALVPPHPDMDIGGTFGVRKDGKGFIKIHVGVSSFWELPLEEQRETLPHIIINPIYFTHEYIHYLDYMRGVPMRSQRKKKEERDEAAPAGMMTEEFLNEYFSDPTEFNAWYQSMAKYVVDEVRHTLKLFKEKLPADFETPLYTRDLQAFMKYAWYLFDALGWPVDELPSKFQRKIKKRLAQTFQHVFGEGRTVSKSYDLPRAIEDVRDLLWGYMNDQVVGMYGYKDPEGVAHRFEKSFGTTVNSFIEKTLDVIRSRSIPELDVNTLEPLTTGERLKFKSSMRSLYKELVKERDYMVSEGGQQRAASVRHHGEVYVQALTPEQKEKKKDYLLSQQLQGRKDIPTWEDVQARYEEDMAIEAGKHLAHEDFRIYLEKWLKRYGYEVDDEAAVEYLEQQVYDDFISDEVKLRFYPLYEEAVARLKRIDGQDCWREIVIPKMVEAASLTGVGCFWSLDRDAASALESEAPAVDEDPDDYHLVRFHGRVDSKYIDPESVYANIYGHIYDVEADIHEVRFYLHAPIFVHSVDIWEKLYESGVSKTVEIEAMRRC